MRRLCGLLTVGLFLGFFAGLAPHLVHHLFEDPSHATSECPFASLAERQPGAPLAGGDPCLAAGAGVSVIVPDRSVLPVLVRAPSEARAPPIASF